MMLARLKRSAVVLAALLSLLASSVAACACTHHGPSLPEETASCHGSATGVESGAISETVYPDLGTGCSCFVQDSKPFAVAKGIELKKSSDPAHAPAIVCGPEPLALVSAASSDGVYPASPHHDSHYRSRAPARAPPRL